MAKVLIIKDADFSAIAVGGDTPIMACPLIEIDSGVKSLTLSVPNESHNIFYTTDGSVPTVESERYLSPITIGNSATIKAISSTGTFSSKLPDLTFEVACVEGQPLTLRISSNKSGTIRYTDTGSNPTAEASAYSTPINIESGLTIKAALYNSAQLASDIATINFV